MTQVGGNKGGEENNYQTNSQRHQTQSGMPKQQKQENHTYRGWVLATQNVKEKCHKHQNNASQEKPNKCLIIPGWLQDIKTEYKPLKPMSLLTSARFAGSWAIAPFLQGQEAGYSVMLKACNEHWRHHICIQ